jgi:hypothetical protein
LSVMVADNRGRDLSSADETATPQASPWPETSPTRP